MNKPPKFGSAKYSIWLSVLLVVTVDLAASEDQGGPVQKPPDHVSMESAFGPQQATTITQPEQQIVLPRLLVPYAFSHLNTEVDGALLKCRLYSSSHPPEPPSDWGVDAIGSGEAFIKIDGKDTAGEAEILVSPLIDKWVGGMGSLHHDLAKAHSYLCQINFVYSGEKPVIPTIEGHNYAIPFPAWSIAKPESTLRVNGLLNQ